MVSFRSMLLTTVSAPAITALGILIPTDSDWTEESHGMPLVSYDIATPDFKVHDTLLSLADA